jgi:hypothetical protein
MTSAINPNNIDGSYPVPGVPNNTQGFRTNFTNTKTNFQYAAAEITELQSKAVLKQSLGTANALANNNMNGSTIFNVKLQDVEYSYLAVTATSGNINIDYAAAMFQQINLTGPVSLSFSNFPASGTVGSVQVAFNITNVSQTVTLPSAVSVGISAIAGISPGTPGLSNTITFSAVGNYAFEFASADGGTSIWIFDQSRAPDTIRSTFFINNATAATSNVTGALRVAGGVGVGGNIYAAGNVHGNRIFGDGGFLSNVTVVSNVAVTQIANGSSTIAVNGSGGNITFTAGGVANIAVLTPSGLVLNGNIAGNANVSGEVFTTGNINAGSGSYFLGNGSLLSGISPSSVFFGNSFVGIGVANGNANISVGSSVNVAVFTSAAAIFDSNVVVLGDVVANVVTTGNLAVTGTVTSNIVSINKIVTTSNAGIGYEVGAGGTATQTTNKTNPVTLNTIAGQITLDNQNLGAGAHAAFVLNNTAIANTDVMIINHVSGGTIGAYTFDVVCNTANASITITNQSAGALAQAPVIRFAVIKSAIS